MLAAIVLAQTLRIGVFGLFEPTELSVRPASGVVLRLDSGDTLEGREAATFRALGDGVEVFVGDRRIVVGRVRAEAGEFVIAVPGKIERRFRGALEITAAGGRLVPVVEMDLETAVASAVAAESPPGAPEEALKAQAVATRSFYVAARGRHSRFEFCDTTHCQFLREPPAESRAARETAGLILTWRDAAVVGLFTASCGGRTRALAHPVAGAYPFFEVECPYCRRGRAARCAYCDKRDGAWANRRGEGNGHGYGLCQTGAAAMAGEGAKFEEILGRYFPNAGISNPGRAERSLTVAAH